MDPERWQLINELFHAALDREPSQRTAFLDEACADDPELRADVRSLLAHHEQKTSLLKTPAGEVPGSSQAPAGSTLIGRHLGQYLVLRRLGQGGMGVVYQAEDTRLGRMVALKALSPEFTGNEERRERLRREARAAAGLSHRAIATVFALEEFDGNLYIATEYIRGCTLHEELENGPLETSPLVSTACEIASALMAAHGQGVIHRDLKPENVIRTPSGGVKVLDFGLARFHDATPDTAPSGTRLTEDGTILGTPGYMSPEQLRGSRVDFRSDLFSFGVMLYELASGFHPFVGADAISTITKVLESEPPDLRELRPASPPKLIGIIRKCVSKQPEERYAATPELAGDLEELRSETSGAEATPATTEKPVPIQDTRPASDRSPLWWWQCHQTVVGLGYYGMLYPLWMVKDWIPEMWQSMGWLGGDAFGLGVFFTSLAAVAVTGTLRLHLSFTSQYYPEELPSQRKRVSPWIRRADLLFIALLVIAAVLIVSAHQVVAALLFGVAIASFIALTVIEPATARAAFRRARAKTTPATARRKTPTSGR